MTNDAQRVDVARLSELLAGIVGDYKVSLGVSQKAFEDFSLRGSPIGKLPNQSWGLHCRRRIEELEALPALLQQLADYQRERAELYDRLNGTPCAEIRWLQEREQLMGELLSLRNARDAGADLDNDDMRDDAGFWFNVAAFRGIELTRQVERAEAAERAREESEQDRWRTDWPEMKPYTEMHAGLWRSERVIVSLVGGRVTHDVAESFDGKRPLWFIHRDKVRAWQPFPAAFLA